MIVGAIIAACLAPPWLVVRSDGSRAGHNPRLTDRNETFQHKFLRIIKREFFSVLAIRHEKRLATATTKTDKQVALFASYVRRSKLVLLVSAEYHEWRVVRSGWPYAVGLYRAQSNSHLSNSNSALYWLAQMFGGFIMGWTCDLPWFSRPKRALIAWSILFIYGNGVMGGGWVFERLRENNPRAFVHFHSSLYPGGAMLYFFYGMLDSLWQSVSSNSVP